MRVDASTIFGSTTAETLHASNSILLGKVSVERRQEGCVRFCYLPFDSESPRRYRCQPENTSNAARVRPRFESVSFGEPAYAQLAGACAQEIVTGAQDEGEMGAWHFVQAPLRLRNLRLALDKVPAVRPRGRRLHRAAAAEARGCAVRRETQPRSSRHDTRGRADRKARRRVTSSAAPR